MSQVGDPNAGRSHTKGESCHHFGHPAARPRIQPILALLRPILKLKSIFVIINNNM